MNFLDALTLLFVAGKFFGGLDWSWWWVFSPTLLRIVAGVVVSALRRG